MLSREDVMEKAREEHVKFLRLQLTDTFGTLKNIAVTSEDLERAMAGKIAFDSSVVDGVASNYQQDIIFRPDLSTFVVFPWRPRNEYSSRFQLPAPLLENTSQTAQKNPLWRRSLACPPPLKKFVISGFFIYTRIERATFKISSRDKFP